MGGHCKEYGESAFKVIAEAASGAYNRLIMARAKKMTIEDLAVITANGFKAVDRRFDEVDKRFEAVDKRFDGIDKRLDRIENLILRDHIQRIERLEDTVLQLKVKVGMR